MTAVRNAAVLAALVAGAAGTAGPVRAQNTAQAQTVAGQNAQLSVARFWRGDGITRFEGVVSTPVGAGNTANPQVEVVITDNAGNVLFSEAWTDTVSQQLLQMANARSDIAISTPLSIPAVKAGTYDLTVRVRRGGDVDSARSRVVAYAEAPAASDLIVSNEVRALGAEDAVTGSEVQMGRFGIIRTARPAIEPTNSTLWYYLELYRRPGAAADSIAQLDFTVVPEAGGNPLLKTTRMVRLGERGGSDVARLPLTGLPPGEYLLRVNTRIGDRTAQSEARFAMASFAAEPIAAPVAAAALGAGEEALYTRYFAPTVLNDSAVARFVEALTIAPLAETFPGYASTADSETQRRALAHYFAKIADPAPATAEHELLEEYRTRAEYAAREFMERDLRRSGLRTERGRVYMKYGPPDVKQLVPIGSASRGAVELWKYNRLRGMKYAFYDETGFHHYTMIYTTDPAAQSLPDWQARVVDREIITLIQSF